MWPRSRCGSSSTPSHELGCGQTTASRATVLGGRAVIEAASKLKARLNGACLADLAGQEFYGEVLDRLDHQTRRRGREPGHPLRLRVGHAGRHPRPTTAGSRRWSRRMTSARSSIPPCSQGRSKAPCTWAWATPVRGVRGLRRDPGHHDAEITEHHPACRDAAGRVHLRRRASARGPVRRQGDRRDRAGPHRERGGRARSTLSTASAEPGCR